MGIALLVRGVTFKINNQEVSKAEFQFVRKAMRVADDKNGHGFFNDKEITQVELDNFCDRDDDGLVTIQELVQIETQIGMTNFLNLDKVLTTHGYRILTRGTDAQSYVQGLVTKLILFGNVTVPEAERPFWGDADFVLSALTMDFNALSLVEPTLLNDADFCSRVTGIFLDNLTTWRARDYGYLMNNIGAEPITPFGLISTHDVDRAAMLMLAHFTPDLTSDPDWITSVFLATEHTHTGSVIQWMDYPILATYRQKIGEQAFQRIEAALAQEDFALYNKIFSESCQDLAAAIVRKNPTEADMDMIAKSQPFLRSPVFVARLIEAMPLHKQDSFQNLFDILPQDQKTDIDFNLKILKYCNSLRRPRLLPQDLLAYPDYGLGAIAIDAQYYGLVAEIYGHDLDFRMAAISANPCVYQYFTVAEKSDANNAYTALVGAYNDDGAWDVIWSVLPETLRTDTAFWSQDKEFLLKALEHRPELYAQAGKYQKDSTFNIEAVKRNPLVYNEMNATGRGDAKIAFWTLRCVFNNSNAQMLCLLEAIPKKLKTSVAFWRNTLVNGYGFFPTKFSGDSVTWSHILSEVPALRTALFDRQSVLKLLGRSGEAIKYLTSKDGFSYDSDPLVVKTAVSDNAKAFNFISPELRTDTTFLAELAFVNFNVLDCFSFDELKLIWPHVVAELARRGLNFSAEMLVDHGRFKNGLRALTKFPERFRRFETIYELMQNRAIDHFTDDKPIVLMIYTTQDGNGAFAYSPVADVLCADERFHVLYYEISDEQPLFGDTDNVFRMALAKGGGSPDGNKLILAGHGRSERLALGAAPSGGIPEPDNPDTERFIFDVMDFANDDFSALLEFLGPSGEWLNNSCGNGYGLAFNPDSLANHCAMAAPDGVKLSFMKIPDNIFTFAVDENGDFDVEFVSDLPYELYGKAGSD